MKRLPHLLGIPLLAMCIASPGLAETRPIKIGVLNDASGPYSANGGEGWVTAAKTDHVAPIADVPNAAVGPAVNEVVRGTRAALIASSAASSDLTGKYCSPNTIQWTFDTWAASHTIGDYLVHHGGKKWYFIATDNALGKAMVRDGTSVIKI